MSGQLQDMKEALGAAVKPDITHVRYSTMVYIARASEYGSAKYQRANYIRPVDGTAADFKRLRGYLRAAKAHIVRALDSMERHQSADPELEDVAGMLDAAYAPDTDAGPTFPASRLPHLSHAAASINMAIEQATLYGLLPADPGQPWTEIMERPIDKLPNNAEGHAELARRQAAERVESRSGRYEMVPIPGGAWAVRETNRDDREYGRWIERSDALRHLGELEDALTEHP